MKKLFYFVLLCGLSFVALAQNQMYVNSANGVNLRNGPGTSYKSLGSVSNGEKLELVSQEGEWAKVKYKGETGYVSSKFLTEEPVRTSERNNSTNNSRGNSTTSPSSGSKTSSSQNSGRSSGYSSSTGSSRNNAANSYNWGVGVRMGNPAGLTFKKYLDRERAWEFSFGHAPYYFGYRYRDHIIRYENFYRYHQYEFLRNPVFVSALGFQLHYLIHKDFIPGDFPGLKWYYGGGAQLRTLTLDYVYRYKPYSNSNWTEYIYDTKTFFALGLDGTIGLEYGFRSVPLSVFTDATLFMELYRRPFLRGQGGLGVRYNF